MARYTAVLVRVPCASLTADPRPGMWPLHGARFQLLDEMIASPAVTSTQRALVAQRIGQVDKCLVDGADEHLQLLDLASYILNTTRSPSGAAAR